MDPSARSACESPTATTACKHATDIIPRRSRSTGLARRLAVLWRRSGRIVESPPLGQNDDSSRSEEHTSELQSPDQLVCRLVLEKLKTNKLIFGTDFS